MQSNVRGGWRGGKTTLEGLQHNAENVKWGIKAHENNILNVPSASAHSTKAEKTTRARMPLIIIPVRNGFPGTISC